MIEQKVSPEVKQLVKTIKNVVNILDASLSEENKPLVEIGVNTAKLFTNPMFYVVLGLVVIITGFLFYRLGERKAYKQAIMELRR